ncbi:hypothetical protein HK098_004033 [Nowakowskiella sp. JEL0407]|nr:hypothetical protein HK098_004033 [Nowakowskiella sp. JEL0407]
MSEGQLVSVSQLKGLAASDSDYESSYYSEDDSSSLSDSDSYTDTSGSSATSSTASSEDSEEDYSSDDSEDSIPPLPFLFSVQKKSSPPILCRPFTSITPERIKLARTKLSQAYSMQKQWRQHPRNLATQAKLLTNSIADDEIDDKPSDLLIVPDQKTVKKRSEQLAVLGLISIASGWDIKLRELVLREARIGDPEHIPLSTPLLKSFTFPTKPEPPQKSHEKSNGLTLPPVIPNAPIIARAQSTLLEKPQEFVRRSSVFSKQNLPTHLTVPSPSDIAPSADSDTLSEAEYAQTQAKFLSINSQYKRRNTTVETIVSGYDERLREIVMEAGRRSSVTAMQTIRRKSVSASVIARDLQQLESQMGLRARSRSRVRVVQLISSEENSGGSQGKLKNLENVVENDGDEHLVGEERGRKRVEKK